MYSNSQSDFQPSLGGSDAIGDASSYSNMQPPISTSSPERSKNQHSNDYFGANMPGSEFGLDCLPTEERQDYERASLIEIYMRMKHAVDGFEQQAEEFKELVKIQLDKNKEIENQNSQQLRHLESVNMMTKYQIVVTKLETTVYNIARSTEAKKKNRLKRAFLKMAENVRKANIQKANKQKLVYVHFENKLTAMVNAFERYTLQRKLHCKFSAWKSSALVAAHARKTQKEGQQALADLTMQIVTSQQEQQSIEKKIKESLREIEQTSVQISQADISLKELNLKSKKVQEKLNQAESQAKRIAAENKNKASTEIKQKIRRIEAKIKNMQEENAAILEKQQQTNNSIGDYISEMSTMLSSAELESALAMEHIDTESDEDYEQDERQLEEMEFEADEGRPHAGTGGSSKLRSRPQNHNYGLQVRQQQPQQQTRQRRTNQQSQQFYLQQSSETATQQTRQQMQQR